MLMVSEEFVSNIRKEILISWRLSKLAMQVSRTTSSGVAWFAGGWLLVLVVGGPRLDNMILVMGIRAGTKVMSRLAAIPAGDLTGKSMDRFDLQSAAHNKDNIRIKGLRKMSLDMFKGHWT
jgi:hypothetical protein